MYKRTITIASLASAGLLLTGCSGLFFAEAEEPSVAITNDVGPLPGTNQLTGGVPVGPVNLATEQQLPAAALTFHADIPLTNASRDGTFKVTTELFVNTAKIHMDSGAGDLAGVSRAELWVYDPADQAGTRKLFASYTRSAGAVADPSSIAFTKSDPPVNFVDYVANKQVSLELVLFLGGAVNLPAADWTGALTLDFSLKARADFPK